MLALILAAAVAAAAPEPATVKPSVITQPDWLQRPAAEDMARYYPSAAAAANIEGQATLRCVVTEVGSLADCTVSDEDPKDQGFGAAALNLAPLFKMRPMTRNGAPVSGGKINIPIRFRLPTGPATPSLTLATRCYGFAAAAAERDPTSQEAQAATTAWRMLLNVRSLVERQRPSEFEQLLAQLRTSATGRLDDPASKTDRDECANALASAGPVMNQLKALVPPP